MIPKIIHYCWFGGNPLPDDVKKYITTWRKYCPDYEIRQWDESNFDVTENQYCDEAYKAKRWAFVSDYARLKILYEYGGIYLDTDVEVVKNLDQLLKYNAFVGFQSDNSIGFGTIGSEAKNEWIKSCLKKYDKLHFYIAGGICDLKTNVRRMTEFTQQMYNIRLDNTFQIFGDYMAIFPAEYLLAKDVITGENMKNDNTYTIHHYAGSWVTNDEREYDKKLKYYRNKLPNMLFLSLIRYIPEFIIAYNVGGAGFVWQRIKKVFWTKWKNE